MAGKLHIHVMYLCAALLMAIFFLAASKEGEAKPVLCQQVIKMGLVTSSQTCTSLCRRKFGGLYYSSVLTNRRNGIYRLEGLLPKSLVCSCRIKKRKGKKCPSDSDSSDTDSDSDRSSSSSDSDSDRSSSSCDSDSDRSSSSCDSDRSSSGSDTDANPS